MTAVSITAADVRPVRTLDQITGPAAEAITAGQYVRLNVANGQIELGNATTLAESRIGGIALESVPTGMTVTVMLDGILDLGDALTALAYDQDIFLGDTDGQLNDALGTIPTVVGRVWPGYGHTTPDKLLRVEPRAANAQPQPGSIKTAVIAGGSAGNHTVTGIAVGDEILGVIRIDLDGTAANIDADDLQSEFTVSAADTINNTGGTDTTGDKLIVIYRDASA